MAGFFLKPSGSSTRGHSRSISLPVRSHPTTIKIEQELNNLILNLQLSPSSQSQPFLKGEKLCMAIAGLSELYKSIGDVLKLPQTQQALSLIKLHDRRCSWVDELLEEPLSFLDVCGNVRENVSLLRETLGGLQSALRRSTGTSSSTTTSNNNMIENNVAHHVSSLKNFKREMSKCMSSLKQIDAKLGASPMINSRDHHLVSVVRVLRETSLMSSVIFRGVLGYFSGSSSSQPRTSKWSLVLKLVNNNKDDKRLNELEDLEAALNGLVVQKEGSEMMAMMVRSTSKKVQVVEKFMEGVERELECLFRQLIQTRVSLLNILSDH